MFEVMWTEVNRSDRLVTKRKSFETKEKMDKYIDRLVEKDNFIEILATR